jgi:exodeoxyribonuclease VII large subunit
MSKFIRPAARSTVASTSTSTSSIPEPVLTVTELNNQIKDYLNINYKNKDVTITGEVSNYKTFNTTIYFTLKDNSSSISCCFWNGTTVIFKNGDQVKVSGRLTVYVKSGQYQLNVKDVTNNGTVGNLYETFEKKKNHYQKLGYFDKPKRQLHPYIDNICVITAQGGAAIQDFLSVLKKNNYTGNVTIKNAVVQGNECGKSVSAALRLVKQLDFDVIVLTRGGGSYEDLCGFNSPEIIEELHNINTITISAIGHEIDTVLTDYVADIRAATPTMAASMITNNLIRPGYYCAEFLNCATLVSKKITEYKNILLNAKVKIPQDNMLLANYHITLSKIKDGTSMFIERALHLNRNKIAELRNAFESVNIKNTLRDYVIIVDKNGNRVTSKKIYTKNIKNKIKMKIVFADGNVIIN